LKGSAGSGNGERKKGLRRGRFQTITLDQDLMTEGAIGLCLMQSGGRFCGAQPKNPEPAEEKGCYSDRAELKRWPTRTECGKGYAGAMF
jgi:hypothetical protein